MITRLAKIALVAAVAFLFTIVVFNNLTDYYSNFSFIQHVMNMDTTYPHNRGMWRAITSPVLHHVFYVTIICWEATAATLCWAGALKCWRRRRGRAAEFTQAKGLAIGALTLIVSMFIVVFLSVGGEWFLMWQSQTWNAQPAAFGMIGSVGLVLLFLSLPDPDLAAHEPSQRPPV
jgi:predicted small integral membrane protein